MQSECSKRFQEAASRLSKESLLTLVQASAEMDKVHGRRISTHALRRWILTGRKGVYLDAIRLSGRSFLTSREAIFRFGAALAESESKPVPVPPKSNHDGRGKAIYEAIRRRP